MLLLSSYLEDFKVTPQNLRQIMDNQNLSNQDLATICDVTYRQIMYWLSGKFPIPRTIAFLLLALDEGTISQDWLANKLEQELRESV